MHLASTRVNCGREIEKGVNEELFETSRRGISKGKKILMCKFS